MADPEATLATTTPVDVSIVVPARDEAKYLPILLQSIAAQRTALAVEVIVVDDASRDGTVAAARAFGARVITNDRPGDVPHARNLGLADARGAAVLFTDADVAFSADYLEAMAGPVVRGEVEVSLALRQTVLEATAPVLPERHAPSYAWFLRHLPGPLLVKIPIRLFPWLGRWFRTMAKERRAVSPFTVPDRVNTPSIVLATALARAAGGWQGRFGTHEDTAFCQAVFARGPRVRWRWRPLLHVSARRDFPTDGRWPLRLVAAPFREIGRLVGLGRNEARQQDTHGYSDPAGRR